MTGSGARFDESAWAALTDGVLYTARPVDVVVMVGPDTRRFANGMFTNNVRDLAVGSVNQHAVVDERARISGFLDLACIADDRFVAILDGISADAFCERYAKYVVFDDVELEPQQGQQSVRAVGRDAPPGPPKGRFESFGSGFRYTSWGWPGAGLRWIVPSEEVGSITSAPHGPSVLAAVRVLAGVPAHPLDSGGKRLPHELGLRDSHLSFDKGCYLGQETINRVDVMGKVRKHLRGVRGAGVATGCEVVFEGAVVGRVGSAVELPGGDLVGLAVLKEAACDPGTAVQTGDAHAEVLALPVRP